ncbi:hypothetical protein NIES4102_31240 [Chondrocystis sp. NIES-4102]|nr:hypothetical protein NIES4102_31240 [Chondrocystis sp. NIES-4102]
MYLSTRGASVRNLATAIINGAITLILLLIAPLGLATVISNTFLVTVASFFVGTFADMIVNWLTFADARKNKFTPFQSTRELKLQKPKLSAIERHKS